MNTRRHNSKSQWTPNRLGIVLIAAVLGSTVCMLALAASLLAKAIQKDSWRGADEKPSW